MPTHSSLGNRRRVPGRTAAWRTLAVLTLWSHSLFAADILRVLPVNVTPGGFSVVFHTLGAATPDISIYADAQGTVDLAGSLGVELFPMHTGQPDLTTAYEQRQSRAALRQKTRDLRLMHLRVSDCQPGTTYYYRVQATGTNGQTAFWPDRGPLPAVTTPLENLLVPSSKQLILELPGPGAEGRLVTLAHAEAAYPLAAVAGDGAGTNQVIFNLTDLFGLLDDGNLILLGDQEFAVQMLGPSRDGNTGRYTLHFTADFSVADSQVEPWDFLRLDVGSIVLRAGESGTVPIHLATRTGVMSISFAWEVPPDRVLDLVLQPVAPEIGSATLVPESATRSLITFTPQPGQLLQGTQQLARISFNTEGNQSSAFVPLRPLEYAAVKPDTSLVANFFVHPGVVTIVAGEPLLSALRSSDGNSQLTLYGKPGTTYQLQYTHNLNPPVEWIDWSSIPLDGLFETFEALDSASPMTFYRALETTP